MPDWTPSIIHLLRGISKIGISCRSLLLDPYFTVAGRRGRCIHPYTCWTGHFTVYWWWKSDSFARKIKLSSESGRIAISLRPSYDSSTPKDWYACVRAAFVMWNPSKPLEYVSGGKNLFFYVVYWLGPGSWQASVSRHRFNENEASYGFNDFCDVQRLRGKSGRKPTGPLLHEGKVNITVYVRVLKDPTGYLWHDFKKYTFYLPDILPFSNWHPLVMTRKQLPVWWVYKPMVIPITWTVSFRYSTI